MGTRQSSGSFSYFFTLLGFCLAAISVCLVGSAPLHPYRTAEQPVQYDSYTGEPINSASAITNIIEVTTNYTLGFVELDDQGWLYNRTNNQTQIQTIVNRFSDELKTNGLLMVVFIHGWKHNAHDGDSNVTMFHKVLHKLADMETLDAKTSKRPARRIAGVYVGWRGLSLDTPVIYNLTFWDRKNTAEVVGHGEVIELLTQLEELRNQSNQRYAGDITNNKVASTKMVAIGHSFGGDVLYCATAPILAERMIENYDPTGQMLAPKTLGDLVILINPAVEAARFETLQRLSVTKSFPTKTCNLAIFTSTADSATGVFFPLGRWFATTFESYQADTDEKRANRQAIGHYQPFINYDLRVINANLNKKSSIIGTNSTAELVQTVDTLKRQIKRTNRDKINNQTFMFARTKLVPRSPNDPTLSPIFNVAVTPALIPDHNTIDRPSFIQFLAQFISLFSSDNK